MVSFVVIPTGWPYFLLCGSRSVFGICIHAVVGKERNLDPDPQDYSHDKSREIKEEQQGCSAHLVEHGAASPRLRSPAVRSGLGRNPCRHARRATDCWEPSAGRGQTWACRRYDTVNSPRFVNNLRFVNNPRYNETVNNPRYDTLNNSRNDDAKNSRYKTSVADPDRSAFKKSSRIRIRMDRCGSGSRRWKSLENVQVHEVNTELEDQK